MSLNASSNTTLPSGLPCNSNSSIYPPIFACFEDPVSSVVFIAFAIVMLLVVLPMCGVILWKGFRQWRFRGRAPSSQSDVFVFYLIATEVLCIVATVLLWSSIHTCSMTARVVGYYIYTGIYPAQQGVHCLTCVERYVAVVHPIIYLGLRASGGLWVRHISCWVVWLLCVGLIGFVWLEFPHVPYVLFLVIFFISLALVTFCTLAVLHNLLHPKVGSEGIDRSKLRALYSILVITGTLLLRSAGYIIYSLLSKKSRVGSEECVAIMFVYWFCFPSIVIVPLLYLHKEGALAWFSCKPDVGRRQR